MRFAERTPYDYLRDALTRVAGQPLSKLAELLPGQWRPATDPATGRGVVHRTLTPLPYLECPVDVEHPDRRRAGVVCPDQHREAGAPRHVAGGRSRCVQGHVPDLLPPRP